MVKLDVNKRSTFTGHKDCVYTIAPHEEKSKFFSGAGDGMVALWDLDEPDKGVLIARLDTSVYALHYKSAQDILIIGQNYQGIHLVKVDSKEEVGSLRLTDAAIFDIQSYEDLVFVGTGDGEVVVVDLPDLTIVKRIKQSVKSARCIALNPPGLEFAVGYSDNQIRVFDLKTFSLKKTIPAHNKSVFTVVYDPGFRYLLSAGRDAHLKVWDVENNYALEKDIVAHMYAINHISYDAAGDRFSTCSMDKSIKIWDAEQFRLLKVIDKSRHAGHGTSVNKLIWSGHQNLLISASDDRSISVWDIKSNAVVDKDENN